MRTDLQLELRSKEKQRVKANAKNDSESVNGIHPAPDIHEHFTIHKGYGTMRTSSRTTSTILSTL